MKSRNKEIVGIFSSLSDMENAIDELTSNGINPSDISVLAGEDKVKERLGTNYKKVEDLADDPRAPRMEYRGEENVGAAQGGLIGALTYIATLSAAGVVIASGGALSTILAATMLAGGASGAVGIMLAKLVGNNHAEYLQTQLENGGLLLWVSLKDDVQQQMVFDIFVKNSARDTHLHEIEDMNVARESAQTEAKAYIL